MTRRQTRIFFVAGTTIFALIFIGLTIDSHMKFGELTHADAITPARHCRQARVAPEELHQLPHAARGGRVLCARPDQDCPAARRGVPPAVPPGSVAVLLRGAPRPADAEPAALGRADHRGHRVSDLGLQYRQPELAATADPRQRGVAAGDRARHAGAGRRLGGSGGARRGGLPAGRHRRVSAVTRCSRASRSSARRSPALATRAQRGASEVPTTRARRKRRRSTSANRSSTRMRYLVPGQTFSAGGQSIMPPLATVLKPEEIDQLVAYLATFK